MDFSIAGILTLDGAANGAVYALLAMAVVLMFSVTRIIFIAQGEYVAFAALTMGLLGSGRVPGTVWLVLGLSGCAALLDGFEAWRSRHSIAPVLRAVALRLWLPVLAAGLTLWWLPHQPGLWMQALLTLMLVTPMGSAVYRLAFRPLADASVLVLLIVSVGVHFALLGLGLWFFGAEGHRTPAFWDYRGTLGSIGISGQTIITFAATVVLIGALFVYFDRTLPGKALRATAVNRMGARLMGIATERCGDLSFSMAAFIGALSGLLIGPTTTVYFDSGFLIGLKGFVAAVFAGMSSFPAALVGALLVGWVESFGSFWDSALKEVIVFTVLLPVLLWRSVVDGHAEEH